jgi:phospholipid/cholesterol/gamma-HCH transport system permease protein
MSDTPRSRAVRVAEDVGDVALLAWRAISSVTKRPLEFRATVQQCQTLGVESMGIVTISSVFIGMVMTIQFAFSLQRFGAIEFIPRAIILSFCRELAPTLTAIIVGGRIGSGIAAEVGAMAVTEQIDAIRALGADPAKKLVLPRLLACVIVLPVLSVYALVLGLSGAVLVCAFEYGISPRAFMASALEVVRLTDFFGGLAKTPFFGFLIAIIGCHYGLKADGGTEGVGQSTTRTVVAVSVAILVADLLLTKLILLMQAV